MMAVGAKGIISVASNIMPAELKQMVDAFFKGDIAKAMELHKKVLLRVQRPLRGVKPDPDKGRHGNERHGQRGIPHASVPHKRKK